ncbi:MAG: 50S ribosomal protein L6 [Patescibacteria group bacterium]
MSRIGRNPINIPEGVEVKIKEQEVIAKGPKGELIREIPREIKAEIKEQKIIISLLKKTKKSIALWGLWRALINNMIEGVAQGFEKQLEIQGIGYRAALQGNKLVLNIGLSHPIEIEAPVGIEFKVEKNIIMVSGIDKQLVGQIAAEIRAQRKPEPYKGKGIRYLGEEVRRKAGKKTAGTE